MNFVARAAVVFCASTLAGAATASIGASTQVPAAAPASKAEAKPVRSDRLEPHVVERETQRRSNPKAKEPVMPAGRG
jgi:hypothetical protein